MNIIESPYKGTGQLTRQQFLFYEMRTTAKLMSTGMEDNSLLEKIISENLYQYPTEKTIKQIASGCIARLHALNDILAIAHSQKSRMHWHMEKMCVIWNTMTKIDLKAI